MSIIAHYQWFLAYSRHNFTGLEIQIENWEFGVGVKWILLGKILTDQLRSTRRIRKVIQRPEFFIIYVFLKFCYVNRSTIIIYIFFRYGGKQNWPKIKTKLKQQKRNSHLSRCVPVSPHPTYSYSGVTCWFMYFWEK